MSASETSAKYDPSHLALSRRERQIMDVIYRKGEASAAEVLAEIPDPPGYSAVRALLRILEQKGHLRHNTKAGRYVFLPTRPRARAARSALRRVLNTFYDNSVEQVVAALLGDRDVNLSNAELDRIRQKIDEAQRGTLMTPDTFGHPALIAQWRGIRSLPFDGYTDAEGRVRWPNAPPDVVNFGFVAKGYNDVRDFPLTPGGEEERVVTLNAR